MEFPDRPTARPSRCGGDTIDFLEQRDVRIRLRQALKQKRRELQQAGRDLTRQIRTLSRYAGGIPAA
jgi:hypothetical protein